MMKKLLSLILATAMVVLATPVTITSAELFTAGDFTYTVTDGEATIVSYYNYGKASVIIPSVLGGCPVTAIKNNAFYNKDEITSVIIPDSVETIGKSAFDSCYSLKKVTFGKGVKFIDTLAFQYCFELSEVHISDVGAWCSIEFANAYSNPMVYGNLYVDGDIAYDIEIPVGTETIGNYAFAYCGTLNTVSFPDSLKTIGDRAFAGCYSLENIIIPDSVETIGNFAFAGCSGIAEVAIPAGVKSIGENAFYGSALTAINVKDGNTVYKSVDGVLFSHDGSVLYIYPSGKKADTYTVPDGVTTIERKAFSYCSGTSEVIIPGSVTSIGTDVFYSSKKLKSVTVGEGITAISDGTFNMCTGLESVTIGKNVSFIGEDAFRDCDNLKDIHISDIAAWCGIKYSSGLYSKPFYYAENMYLDGELVEDLVIPDGVTTIGDNAFYGCEGLKSVTVSDTVTTIGSYAFYLCKNLTDVSLPDSVTHIKGAAFTGTALYRNKDNWDNKLLYIGNHLIEADLPDDSDEFTSPYIYDDVTVKSGTVTIANGAFSYCGYFYGITIPSSVTAIGNNAFNECKGIVDVYYGGSEDDFSQISIGVNNEAITAETVRMHYNVTDPEDHYKSDNIIKDSTCTESGTSGSICSCGHSKGTITIPPKGHDIVRHNGKAATCMEGGYAAYETCNNCSYTTYKALPVTDHSITKHAAKAPTCTDVGWFAYESCKYCGEYTTYVELRAYGHTFTDGVCEYCSTVSGDVNMDGKVNLGDVSLLLKHIAKWDVPLDTTAADVTDDRKVNLADVSLMLKYIAKWNVVLGK